MYKIYNTQQWDYEKIEAYGKPLRAAIEKLAIKFPGDIDTSCLLAEIASGRQNLWLILDEQQKFCAFLTTELSKNLQGENRLTLCQLGGSGGVSLADMLPQIEKYARENQVKEIVPIGRPGWYKQLRIYGYKPLMIKYRKEL